MKALKILGIVFGILLLLTGGGLLAGSALASKGEGAFEQELAKSGYTGPVEGTVKSVEQTSPVIVTVTYTDKQGKTQTGQGAASGATPPKVGDKVSTYYSTSDPSQILVVNVPGLANLSGVAATLQISGIICLIAGGVLLLAGILGLVLGKEAGRGCGSSGLPDLHSGTTTWWLSDAALPATAAAWSAVSAAAAARPALSASAVPAAAVPASAISPAAIPTAAAWPPAAARSAKSTPAIPTPEIATRAFTFLLAKI